MIADSFLSFEYPPEFVVAALLVIGFSVEAFYSLRKIWAIPALLVYSTVGAWYLGDIISEGPGNFRMMFGDPLTSVALWQVSLFLISYRVLVYLLLRRAKDSPWATSVVARLDPMALRKFLVMLCWSWALLFVVGLWRTEWDLLGIIWPPNSREKVAMFSTPGVGAGADFLVSAANYVYILICALFGVCFVLIKGRGRFLALALVVLSWPYYFFDRTRHVMLALLLPSIFCYWIASDHSRWKKLAMSALLFSTVNMWFLNVMRYRATDQDNIADLLDFSSSEEEVHHLGLDMLSELCFMDYFIETGSYDPPWGRRYFAEIAQVVPRTFWTNKPMIGIDYAIARGFGARKGEQEGGGVNAAGVYATVATGMLGQGVENFGRFIGVLSTAFLMTLWTRVLAHLWIRRFEVMRFLLFLVGCGLTFNMGRDITLLVLWPFAFGYCLVLVIEGFQGWPARSTLRSSRRLGLPLRS